MDPLGRAINVYPPSSQPPFPLSSTLLQEFGKQWEGSGDWELLSFLEELTDDQMASFIAGLQQNRGDFIGLWSPEEYTNALLELLLNKPHKQASDTLLRSLQTPPPHHLPPDRFNPTAYAALKADLLASQELFSWQSCMNLYRSQLILIVHSPYSPAQSGLSISSGLLHLVQHLAKTEQLSESSLSAYFPPEECESLIRAEKEPWDQAVYETLKGPLFEQLCLKFTPKDKAAIGNAFEEALRAFLYERAFENDSFFGSRPDDRETEWLDALLDKQRCQPLYFELVHQEPQFASDPSHHFHLGKVELPKKGYTVLHKLEFEWIEPLFLDNATPTERVAQMRQTILDQVCVSLLEFAK